MAQKALQVILPPALKSDWIGGNFRSFRKAPTEFLTRLAKLGDITSFRMGPQQGYFVNDPELIRDVLVVNAHKFVKGRALQRAKGLLGEGLLTSEGDMHLRHRRMIQPAFHRARIAEYAHAMVMYADRMAGSWQAGDVRDIDKEMMHLTLQIVAKTLFSADVTDEANEIGGAMTALVHLFNYLLLPFSEWLEKLPLPQSKRFAKAKETLNSVIYGIIDERRSSGEDTGDLLSMLLAARDEETGDAMTDEQIRDEALTLFLAGHETTANAMTWTWYLLSQNPEMEARLHAELDSVIGSRVPAMDDLPNLKFTEAVIAESMRLFPPAWAIGRLSTQEHILGDYHLPKSSLVLISPYITHRDGRFWENPDEFQPERWQTLSVKEAGQRNIYLPFGGGTRRCIGEGFAWTEGILLLTTLARKWKLRMVPEQKIGLQPMITLRPKFGMRMQISAR
ncbi:MAG: cytochrome P450 [Acidobacteriota bacterium]